MIEMRKIVSFVLRSILLLLLSACSGGQQGQRFAWPLGTSSPENTVTQIFAEKFADEWFLILQKKSSLPASVRYPVRDICQAAMNQCYHDKLVALYKKQQEEKEKADK